MLGPNGSGKTTVLRTSRRAGCRSTQGRIAIDELVVDDAGRGRVRRARATPDRGGVPGLPAVRAYDGAGERRLRTARPQDAEGEGPPGRRATGSSGWGSATTPCTAAARAVGRAGAAGRLGPGAGDRPADAAARRAARRARRRHAEQRPPRPAPPSRDVRRHANPGDPRPRRCLRARRPGRHPRCRAGSCRSERSPR